MIVTKDEFVENYLKVLERELKEKLPDKDFESNMIEKSYMILYEKTKHIVN
jgi:hypothetical protein